MGNTFTMIAGNIFLILLIVPPTLICSMMVAEKIQDWVWRRKYERSVHDGDEDLGERLVVPAPVSLRHRLLGGRRHAPVDQDPYWGRMNDLRDHQRDPFHDF